MSALVFVDTNVLVYARDRAEGAANAAGCKYILTEDLNHGQKLENLEVVNPFRRVPESLD